MGFLGTLNKKCMSQVCIRTGNEALISDKKEIGVHLRFLTDVSKRYTLTRYDSIFTCPGIQSLNNV